jgi:hypothetical protein
LANVTSINIFDYPLGKSHVNELTLGAYTISSGMILESRTGIKVKIVRIFHMRGEMKIEVVHSTGHLTCYDQSRLEQGFRDKAIAIKFIEKHNQIQRMVSV